MCSNTKLKNTTQPEFSLQALKKPKITFLLLGGGILPARVGPVVSDGVVEVAPLPIVVGGSRSSGREQRRR